jgi:hypothetical protein
MREKEGGRIGELGGGEQCLKNSENETIQQNVDWVEEFASRL